MRILALAVFVAALCSPALAAKFCPDCGAKMASESAKFCAECGKAPEAVVTATVPKPATELKHEDLLARYFLITMKNGKRCEIPTAIYVERLGHLGDYQVTRKFIEAAGGKFRYSVRIQATNTRGQMMWQSWTLRIQTEPEDKIIRFSNSEYRLQKNPPVSAEEDVNAADFAGDVTECPPLRLAPEGAAAQASQEPARSGVRSGGLTTKMPWEK